MNAGEKVARPAELKRSLMYVVIAEARNMGLAAMAESYDVLAWTAEWYLRPEALEAANATVVNYHHRLPLTRASGSGIPSSSDGQRFPVKGKSIIARPCRSTSPVGRASPPTPTFPTSTRPTTRR